MRKSTIRVGILLIVMLALVAWQPNNNEAPYTGSYSVSYPTSGEVRSNATSVKWTSTAISNMDGDVNAEYLDQTADCTTDSPEGDKLYPLYVTTNIPDRGVSRTTIVETAPGGRVSMKRLSYINEDSLTAGTSYYYNITWDAMGRRYLAMLILPSRLESIMIGLTKSLTRAQACALHQSAKYSRQNFLAGRGW